MGTDIHWIIERRHADGGWEAVDSKFALFEHTDLFTMPREQMLQDPRFLFSQRDYAWFRLLADIRSAEEGAHPMLGIADLPRDASPYADLNLSFDGDLHSHGHLSLAGFRRAVQDGAVDGMPIDPDERASARQFLEVLETLIADPARTGRILRGETGPVEERTTPDPSAHERLWLTERAKDLLPIDGESLRIVYAFDN